MFPQFGNKDKDEAQLRRNSAAAIKKWIGEKMQLGEYTTVMVTEVNCWEPNCPDKETVIAILQEGDNQKFTIRKPSLYVRKWDIDALFKL